jgi:predicted phage terminase large subunit-like protein
MTTVTAVTEEPIEIRPHEGPQERFLMSDADIVIYGGAAGGGKSYAILLDPLYEAMTVKGFSAVIFRRTHPEIKNPGGLWDTSRLLYPLVDAGEKVSSLQWVFPGTAATVKFAHMQHEKNKYDWQGSQIPYIGFDELTHFDKSMFFYMLSRNRSGCGVKARIRATCNPDPDSWVRAFIIWWINTDTGYPIPERDGVIRYFARVNDELEWADTAEELTKRGLKPKSVTFIGANIYDNPTLLKGNPDYVASLQALTKHERDRLLGGNWNARAKAGDFFKRESFEIVDVAPAGDDEVRYWDRACTEESEHSPNPDWTVGLKMRKVRGVYYVLDLRRFRASPGRVENAIKIVASQEPHTTICLEQDPGQAGEAEVSYLIKGLAGYDVKVNRVTTAKDVRAKPVAAQAEAGNVKLVRGEWNDAFLDEMDTFPDPKDKSKDDQVDTLSGAFNYLTRKAAPSIRTL